MARTKDRPDELKLQTAGCRLYPEEMEALQELAKLRQTTVSKLLREAVLPLLAIIGVVCLYY